MYVRLQSRPVRIRTVVLERLPASQPATLNYLSWNLRDTKRLRENRFPGKRPRINFIPSYTNRLVSFSTTFRARETGIIQYTVVLSLWICWLSATRETFNCEVLKWKCFCIWGTCQRFLALITQRISTSHARHTDSSASTGVISVWWENFMYIYWLRIVNIIPL